MFSEFKCSHTQTSNYTLRRLQPAVKAMQYALRTKIRMNQVRSTARVTDPLNSP